MVRRMKPAIDPSLLSPLGQLSANFNMLELTTSSFIWVLIGSDQRTGQIVTAGMPFRGLVDLLCALYRHRVSDPDKLATLEELRKRLEDAADKRNTFLHSAWGAAGQRGASTRIKTTARGKTGLQFTFQRIAAADIQAVADDIATLAADVMNLMLATLDQSRKSQQE